MQDMSRITRAAIAAEQRAREAARMAAANYCWDRLGEYREMPVYIQHGSELLSLRRVIAARTYGRGRIGTIWRAAQLWRERSEGTAATEAQVIAWEMWRQNQ